MLAPADVTEGDEQAAEPQDIPVPAPSASAATPVSSKRRGVAPSAGGITPQAQASPTTFLVHHLADRVLSPRIHRPVQVFLALSRLVASFLLRGCARYALVIRVLDVYHAIMCYKCVSDA